MDERTVARIEGWDRRTIGDGRVGLSRLADGEFSGAVEARGAWLFMLNGRVVGTSGTSVESIGVRESLTAYTAPHPSLPLVFAMRDRGGEIQGRYFTDDTPLAEVHDTLSSGSFTGYVDLSENVHSGDYYVVYYGGRALFAAFVGAAGRLVTDDEAFERAKDEVGIYEVRSVDLDVRDVPDPPEDATGEAGGAGGSSTVGTSGAAAGGTAGTADAGVADPESGLRDPDPDAALGGSDAEDEAGDRDEPGVEGEDDDGDGPSPDADEDVGPADASATGANASGGGVTPREDVTPGSDDPSPEAPAETRGTTADTAGNGRPDDSESTLAGGVLDEDGDGGSGLLDPGGMLDDSGDDDGAAWEDGRTVPALDPDRTGVPTDGATTGSETGGPEEDPSRSGSPSGATEAAGSGRRIAELEAEIEDLRERVRSLNGERDRLAAERDQAVAERDRLQARLDDLDAGDGAETDVSPGAALANTDLFVRYDSKGKPTLADVHDGDASAEAVAANRRLEAHTRIEADDPTVEGEPLESFLSGTLPYRFVAWLTAELAVEIRETGNESALGDLYGALPEIDRAEFDATVTVTDADGGERSVSFDVVLRDQMDQPLLVADIDEGRDPTDGRLMSDLLDRAEVVAKAADSLAGAVLVTSSFFHSEVHEAVKDATETGLLDRGSKASFVKTSRTGGYHVGLVEARSEQFHVSRPDL